MNSKNSAAIIVSYFPTEDLVINVGEVSSSFSRVVIVDNTPELSEFQLSLFKRISSIHNVEVLFNNKNLGMSIALNMASDILYENGFRYTLLLDQDSFLSKKDIEALLLLIMETKAGIVSPKIATKNFDSNATYVTEFNKFLIKKLPVNDKPLKVMFNITSGSLVDLYMWKEIGGYDENLFIEYVDTEFALRANTSGYDVLISPNATLIQEYGAMTKKKFFGKYYYPTNHSPLRYYYQCRNRLYVSRKYIFKYPSFVLFDFASFVKNSFLVMIFEEDKLDKLKFSIIGFIDFFLGKMGKK